LIGTHYSHGLTSCLTPLGHIDDGGDDVVRRRADGWKTETQHIES
jgi:hypothetical protein